MQVQIYNTTALHANVRYKGGEAAKVVPHAGSPSFSS